jgi:hypothetical protein
MNKTMKNEDEHPDTVFGLFIFDFEYKQANKRRVY